MQTKMNEVIQAQNEVFPTVYQVSFYSPTEDVSGLNGEYTMPEARDICRSSQNTKCKLYDDHGFYKGHVDYDGSFFLT